MNAWVLASASGGCAAVFLWAGVAKLRNPFPASLAIVRFGLLKRVTPGAGRVAGAIESLAGTLLLLAPFALWAWALPSLLALAFVGMTARALLRGQRFDCACFGSGKSEIGTGTLVRAGVLLVVSVGAMFLATGCSLGRLEVSARTEAFAVGCLGVVTVNRRSPPADSAVS